MFMIVLLNGGSCPFLLECFHLFSRTISSHLCLFLCVFCHEFGGRIYVFKPGFDYEAVIGYVVYIRALSEVIGYIVYIKQNDLCSGKQ